jgi:hypothetical protein
VPTRGGFKEWIARWTGRGSNEAELRRAAERTGELLEDQREGAFAGTAALPARRTGDGGALAPIAPKALARLSPAPTPLPERAYYVSYAWGNTCPDATPEECRREQVVDALCEAKRREGIAIIRDRDAMRLGDSIKNFMEACLRSLIFVSDDSTCTRGSPRTVFGIWNESRRRAEVFREVGDRRPTADLFRTIVVCRHWAEEFEGDGGDRAVHIASTAA